MLVIRNDRSKEHYINEDLKNDLGFSYSKMLRVIGPEGEQLGLLSYSAALEEAYDRGYDLVLMAAQADPPVCKIIDYGKFRFERDKKEKEAKKKQNVVDIKEIQLTCQIDIGDFNTKANHAIKFLTSGNKVKVIVKFRGRQMSRLDVGRDLLARFAEECAEVGTIDKQPVLEGRSMIMFLGPVKPEKTKAAKPKAESTETAVPAETEEAKAEDKPAE